MRIVRCVIVVLLVAACPAVAQPTSGHWLVGTWEGEIEGIQGTRIIEVTAVEADGIARGRMGISGQRLGPAEIQVDGSRVHVVNAIKSVAELSREGDDRLVGAITGRDGRSARLIMTRAKPDPQSIIGEWQGEWGDPREMTNRGSYFMTITKVEAGKVFIRLFVVGPRGKFEGDREAKLSGNTLVLETTSNRAEFTIDGDQMRGIVRNFLSGGIITQEVKLLKKR